MSTSPVSSSPPPPPPSIQPPQHVQQAAAHGKDQPAAAKSPDSGTAQHTPPVNPNRGRNLDISA